MIFLGKEISKARILKRLFKSSYEKKKSSYGSSCIVSCFIWGAEWGKVSLGTSFGWVGKLAAHLLMASASP